MPTLSIHFEPEIIAHLAKASANDTIHLSLSLGEGDEPVAPTPVVPRGPLAELMKAGLLKAGAVLTFHQPRVDRRGRAVVTGDGELIVDGHPAPFPSPSNAAAAVTGNPINGWTLWHLEDGQTLDDLRKALKRKIHR
ncbi:DUF4357 domain-containing protein [Streptomyces sp. KK5PA1]|uniref:DUF4357 domain-containing protein n=2 Tax=Actinacidiphila acididurans TaxID=2784346 RepID=A0ABS2TQ62_9ACTN|nr:DUF4357 domain-containing protein [Actinacidiphila acididurans]